MKVKFYQIEIRELNVLKDEIFNYISYQKENIKHSKDDSEIYMLVMLTDIGRDLYFSFGTRIINNLKSHGSTHCTFSISVAEAAFLQYVCCFDLSNKHVFTKFVLQKIGDLIDQKIKSINWNN